MCLHACRCAGAHPCVCFLVNLLFQLVYLAKRSLFSSQKMITSLSLFYFLFFFFNVFFQTINTTFVLSTLFFSWHIINHLIILELCLCTSLYFRRYSTWCSNTYHRRVDISAQRWQQVPGHQTDRRKAPWTWGGTPPASTSGWRGTKRHLHRVTFDNHVSGNLTTSFNKRTEENLPVQELFNSFLLQPAGKDSKGEQGSPDLASITSREGRQGG